MPFPKLQAKTFASIRELTGISARTMEEHYELYKGYVNKTNEIQTKLESVDRASANQIYSDLRALRVDLSFATGGVKNHEIYFEHLGGGGGNPDGATGELIEQRSAHAARLESLGIHCLKRGRGDRPEQLRQVCAAGDPVEQYAGLQQEPATDLHSHESSIGGTDLVAHARWRLQRFRQDIADH